MPNISHGVPLNVFIEKGLTTGEIALLDQGVGMRTYCYILDTVEVLFKILMHGKEKVYNVGGVSDVTIRELANKIGNLLNCPVSIPGDDVGVIGAPDSVRIDLSTIKREFDKSSFVDLEEGLHRTITWQRQLYQRTN